ncbi:MAG: hypothetical protein NW224_30800 [Leptolyngbyaceae cyanobacterium bins.302]|nr:hypothetical protein [Leptolyngbyaceae cyanobacterium bins.302]
MTRTLTIQLPDGLEQQLTHQAQQLNLSLEDFILQSLAQVVRLDDPDDEPKESVLAGLRQAWQEVRAGKTIPLENLWDDIDD